MPVRAPLFLGTAANATIDPSDRALAVVPFECYCGLGTACPAFRQMTAAQREICSRDHRQTAQWMYINGMEE